MMLWRFGNRSRWTNIAQAHRLELDHSAGSGGIGPSWRIYFYYLIDSATSQHKEEFAKFDNAEDADAEFDALLRLLTAEPSSGYVIDVSPKTGDDS